MNYMPHSVGLSVFEFLWCYTEVENISNCKWNSFCPKLFSFTHLLHHHHVSYVIQSRSEFVMLWQLHLLRCQRLLVSHNCGSLVVKLLYCRPTRSENIPQGVASAVFWVAVLHLKCPQLLYKPQWEGMGDCVQARSGSMCVPVICRA